MLAEYEKGNLLLIDDNPGDRLLITEYLGEFLPELKVIEAGTYHEAESILKTSHDFSAILLDLTLPDKSGTELIDCVIRNASNIPVVVLTGYTDLDFGRKSLGMGVADYLIKDDLTAQSLYKSILYSIERKKRSFELEESQRQYRNLFLLSPQPMWVYDTESYKFLDVNESAILNYGYSRDEFLSMTILDIRPESEIPRLLQTIAEERESNLLKEVGHFTHIRKNGEQILVHIRSSVIYHGEKEYRLVLAVDVTERQNYINAVEKQNATLREIAWIQSHLFRAPLARLMGLAKVAAEELYSPELPREKVMQYILESAAELDELIKGITAKTEGIDLENNTRKAP